MQAHTNEIAVRRERMPMQKTILVTGASSGMGKEGALRLIRAGHVVYGAARRIDKMQDLVEAGGRIVALDVTDARSVEAAISNIISEAGRIDVLWNNAGYSVTGAVEDVSDAEAKRQFDVNLFGVANVTKAVLPHMRKHKSGTIINTSSVGGRIFSPLGAWYHASKHALEGWSDCLRIELKPFNINVVVIQPGGIATEFGDVLLEPLLERSAGGAYERLSLIVAEAYEENYSEVNNLSPPSVVGDAVVRIVRSRRPRTRYAMGYMANTVLFLRWLLSDRLFEMMIMRNFR